MTQNTNELLDFDIEIDNQTALSNKIDILQDSIRNICENIVGQHSSDLVKKFTYNIRYNPEDENYYLDLYIHDDKPIMIDESMPTIMKDIEAQLNGRVFRKTRKVEKK